MRFAVPPMSDSMMVGLGATELAGLAGLLALVRVAAKRKAAGKGRLPRWLRVAGALVGLAVMVGFPVLIVLQITAPARAMERRQAELIATGVRATATITDVQETGTVVNRRPQARASLRVEPKDAPPFAYQWTWAFSVRETQTYVVGARVRVFFDPADRATVAVVSLAE